MATNRSDIILGVQNRTSAELRNVGRDLRAASVEATRAERAFTGVERGIDRVRDSEIRAARASHDYGLALQRIDSELARTAQGTVRYNDLLARQAVVGRQAVDGSRSIASAFNGIGAALSAAGLVVGAQQLLQYGVSAFQSSQKLQGTQASVRVLAGDTSRYNQVLDLARKNQEQYGGSLEENTAQLIGFTVASRRAGVGVKDLNDLSQRLAVLSPEQGAAGASIAINEALSGNATSLIRRFEIPAQLLNGISDASTTAQQKLAILSAALDASGVSSAAVAAQTTEAERAVNRAAAAFDDLQRAAGQGAAPGVERVATGLSRLIGLVTQNPQAIADLKAVFSGQGSDLAGAQQQVARTDVNRQLGPQASASTLGIRAGAGPSNATKDFTPERLNAIRDALVAAKIAGGDFATTADRLLQGYRDGSIGAADFSQRTDLLTAAIASSNQTVASSTPLYGAWAASVDTTTSALGEQITATQTQRAEQEKTNAVQAELSELAGRVAAGLLGNADAASILASHYGFASGEAYRLVAAQAALATPTVTEGRLERDTPADRAAGAAAGAAAARTRAEALAAATRAQTEALESSAQRAARLRRELAQLTPATAAYVAKQTEVALADRQAASERTRASRAATTADGRAVRSAEDLRKARFDLLSTEQQIADLKQRVASGRLSEVDRLEATKQIRDLEEKITDEREKQTKSAIDARLAALDDAKQRRIEERELSAARRVLGNAGTSGDQKAAAADVLQRVELERAKRALEIGDKTREAGGVSAALPSVSAPGRGPVVAPLPGGAGAAVAVVALPTGTTAGGDISQQLLDALKQITFTAYIDGTPLAGNLVATLRTGLAGTRAGGIGKL